MAPSDRGPVSAKFLNFDDEVTYHQAETEAARRDALNFVVEFTANTIGIAFDLDGPDFEELLQRNVAPGHVRWINIWTQSRQREAIELIGQRYGFSDRLRSLMSAPSRGQAANAAPVTIATWSPRDEKRGDVEQGCVGDSVEQLPAPHGRVGTGLALYQLVKETMNYTSLDQGDQFVCIGANWLHLRPERSAENSSQGSVGLVPPKHWSWLGLCSDYTVLSFHEDPVFETPPRGEDRERWEADELRSMRSNTMSVLLQLSDLGYEKHKADILSLKAVRQSLPRDGRGSSQEGNGIMSPQRVASFSSEGLENYVSAEGSSNLLFYLFEDYTSAVPILKSSQRLLADLSREVLASPHQRGGTSGSRLDIVPRLHALSKELRQLQHLFESYKRLIHRIVTPSVADVNAQSSASILHLSAGVVLSKSAKNRFDRLGDRLQLLMLDTIKEYIEEKSALSDTYFALTNQKDSQAIARLTRSATLLAKLTVFFLPISFVTSFFSVSVPDMAERYTAQQYWTAFGIILGVSFVSLFFFSRLLMLFTELLEDWATNAINRVRHTIRRRVDSGVEEHD